MANGVVADNWSLQDISSLLENGFDSEPSGEILVSDTDPRIKLSQAPPFKLKPFLTW